MDSDQGDEVVDMAVFDTHVTIYIYLLLDLLLDGFGVNHVQDGAIKSVASPSFNWTL